MIRQYINKTTEKLYEVRFSESDREIKNKLWKVLCSDFLQSFIPKNAIVVDLAAGYCEFINNIVCKKKIAVDLNPATKKYANEDIKVINISALHLPKNLSGKIDVVFCGCFLEHLPSKEDVFQLFKEVLRILKPGGRFIILNPNIRFSTSDYWDFFDHLLPISDRSAVEGLELAGFKVIKVVPKFVPNTTKDKLPKSPLLLKIYLRLPFLFQIFGRQMLIIAQK